MVTFSRDILYCIALRINDKLTMSNFLCCSKVTSIFASEMKTLKDDQFNPISFDQDAESVVWRGSYTNGLILKMDHQRCFGCIYLFPQLHALEGISKFYLEEGPAAHDAYIENVLTSRTFTGFLTQAIIPVPFGQTSWPFESYLDILNGLDDEYKLMKYKDYVTNERLSIDEDKSIVVLEDGMERPRPPFWILHKPRSVYCEIERLSKFMIKLNEQFKAP